MPNTERNIYNVKQNGSNSRVFLQMRVIKAHPELNAIVNMCPTNKISALNPRSGAHEWGDDDEKNGNRRVIEDISQFQSFF